MGTRGRVCVVATQYIFGRAVKEQKKKKKHVDINRSEALPPNTEIYVVDQGREHHPRLIMCFLLRRPDIISRVRLCLQTFKKCVQNKFKNELHCP